MPLYPAIYRTLRLFYPGDIPTRRLLKELEKSQWLSREELDARQLARLQRVVKHAYEHVPYYHDLYRSLDIHPEDIRSLKDLEALPILTKEDVVENLERMVTPEIRGRLQIMDTGGSTGIPLRVYIERSYWSWISALEVRGRSWYGVKEGEKTAWVWSSPIEYTNLPWTDRLKAALLQERYLNPIYLTKASMKAYAEMLSHWHPMAIEGAPWGITYLAQYVQDHGIQGIRPKMIETRSEKLTESRRKLMEEVFQCKVADAYSSRELGPLAFQCEAGGRHVTEGCHLEIIKDGRAVQAGESGEVVLTSLHQFGMPLIRYNIKDMAVYEPGPCSCGRGLPVLREVIGRSSNFIVTADGQYTGDSHFQAIFQTKQEVARYQVYQPDLEHLEVRIVMRREVDAKWMDQLKRELQAPFGERMNITIKVMDELPLTRSGKLLTLITDVKNDVLR